MPMVDPRRIEEMLRNLDNYLANLYRLSQFPAEDLINDPIKLGAAKYFLQVVVECCIDLANHLIARYGWRRPESMADAFTVLAENSVIEQDFLLTLQRMARFRNRLVHLYWEVDAPTIYQLMQENLGDIEQFKTAIIGYTS
jgi:uncharacterized protein YutE (UPF0331/DUF86 family)